MSLMSKYLSGQPLTIQAFQRMVKRPEWKRHEALRLKRNARAMYELEKAYALKA